MKELSKTLQDKQLAHFLAFKKEQKELITSILEREGERKFFENFNKKLQVMNIRQARERKREEQEFSKGLGAQINMLNKVAQEAFKRKQNKDQNKEKQITHQAFKSRGHSEHLQSMVHNIKKVDLTDSLSNYFELNDSQLAAHST